MSEIRPSVVEQLKTMLSTRSPQDVLPQVLGASTTAGGLWRFFSSEGITHWNIPTTWRATWPRLSPELFFFGEDIFGNQLTLKPGSETVWLWNHENGEFADLLLDAATLLETVIQSGMDWIDFYSPEMLAVGRARLLDVPENCHLHWTQPLILGGPVTAANTSVVENVMHLRGHGSLYAQLHGLSPGTEVIIKPVK
jgi:hypothetical protein